MDAYLLEAARTPFGRHRGGLAGIRTDDLAALPIAELIRRHPGLAEPDRIDDVVLGDANGAGEDNRNVARMAALLAGLPPTVPGVTVNRLCASGGEAIVQAARAVARGRRRPDRRRRGGGHDAGRRSCCRSRTCRSRPRRDCGHTQVGWRMVNPKFPAEWTVEPGRLRRGGRRRAGHQPAREQDEWALRSHRLASAAWDAGLHDDYVFPVEAAGGTVKRDESIRAGHDRGASSAALKPAFTADGTVTAGNSSPINDGAIAVLVGSSRAAADLGLGVLGRVVASATVARRAAPVLGRRRCRRSARCSARAGLTVSDIAVWEINEAFAAMVLSCLHAFPEIDRDRVNPHGGAIAIGHPLGASAPRGSSWTLCRELRRRGGGYGVAAACIGVGQGTAIVVHVD